MQFFHFGCNLLDDLNCRSTTPHNPNYFVLNVNWVVPFRSVNFCSRESIKFLWIRWKTQGSRTVDSKTKIEVVNAFVSVILNLHKVKEERGFFIGCRIEDDDTPLVHVFLPFHPKDFWIEFDVRVNIIFRGCLSHVLPNFGSGRQVLGPTLEKLFNQLSRKF